jgi:two-component sensor histidine kinase
VPEISGASITRRPLSYKASSPSTPSKSPTPKPEEPEIFSERLRRLGARWDSRSRKEDVRALQRRLQELEMRFEEYDHRVKNNTQMMLSILAAASRSTTNAEASSVLESVTRKLEAIMHVQALLQRAAYAHQLHCDEFIRELAQRIRDSSPRQFVLTLECEPMDVPSKVAVPLGLILNELLTNAIKHGIGPGNACVHVRLRAVGESIELRVEDNGPGFSTPDLPGGGVGLSMVQHLAAQLQGRFETRPGPGGHCILRFRKPAAE